MISHANGGIPGEASGRDLVKTSFPMDKLPMKNGFNGTPEVAQSLERVFVYGTLKRGECRAKCWPVSPLCIQNAWALGSLVDLGPYPALLAGADRIWGEVWTFPAGHIESVFQTLDRIEGTNQAGMENEYDRVRLRVTLDDGTVVEASTYLFADQTIATRLQPLTPWLDIDGIRYVKWPVGSAVAHESLGSGGSD